MKKITEGIYDKSPKDFLKETPGKFLKVHGGIPEKM